MKAHFSFVISHLTFSFLISHFSRGVLFPSSFILSESFILHPSSFILQPLLDDSALGGFDKLD
jgi:hypothetical protein